MKEGVVGMRGWHVNPVGMKDLVASGVMMVLCKRGRWQREGRQG
jgi:hypothetical protein